MLKKINPSILLPLKDCLSKIYWYKSDLKLFLYGCTREKTSHILSTIDFKKTKYEYISELIDRMVKREDIYQEDLIAIIYALVNFNDFSHLRKIDDHERLIKEARDSITRFKILTTPMLKDLEMSIVTDKYKISENNHIQIKLDELMKKYNTLALSDEYQKRGYEFELFLNSLFKLFDIQCRGSFKTNGEQIDGAFTLDSVEYLLEAKWQKNPICKSDIYSFKGKIDTKLKNTLGLFISVNGYSNYQYTTADFPQVILCDSLDIISVLEGRIELDEMIKRKKQEASRTGNVLFHPC